MRYTFFLLSLLALTFKGSALEPGRNQSGYVSVELNGQFGNQLFQIATAYAYALDNNLKLTVPDLARKNTENVPKHAKEVFLSKIDSYEVPVPAQLNWKEPSFNYKKIPASNGAELHGFFQSDKYFKHRRNEVLALFAPEQELTDKILAKYPLLNSAEMTVAVQIRDYRKEEPQGRNHPTIGRDYYEQAMAYFPDDAIFIVSTNNVKYAKECTQGLKPNIIYLDDPANYIEEFYVLSLCKSFIISNSSFGWWAAWLSTGPGKVVIAPSPWFALPYNNKEMSKDLLPEQWYIVQYRNASNHR